ncbi:hypothetical protein HPP92_008001 [Vanilla planifolia]|uniref:F-box domain-containing protein n=1 Tax=Vanilla planifolia TaxID=51239 RepID=A0A835VB86_VANPL|nr:hypothetical protein HPP92_008001 [Vanilla planifolia]
MMRERNSEFFFQSHDWLNREINDYFGCGGFGDDGDRAYRSGTNDPVDLLPADPFEMDIVTSFSAMDLGTTISAAITGWIGTSPGDYDGDEFVTGLSCYWNRSLLSSSFTQLGSTYGFEVIFPRNLSGSSCSFDNGESFGLPGAVGDVSVSHNGYIIPFGGGREPLHDALLFSLGYLGVQDLLSMEMVCRSLRSAVREDSLLWRSIHIDSPLDKRLTDDDLYCLTQRAQGTLHSLSLVGCSRITADGLKRVLETNPTLKKLSIPGCLRLSIDGLIDNLKALKLSGKLGITSIKFGRMFILSQNQYEELKLLVGMGEQHQNKSHKPQYFHQSLPLLAGDDDSGIDVECCPMCQKYKLVFDCPSEGCHDKVTEPCRACDACIARCCQCGRCVNNCKYMETFSLDYLCSGCLEIPNRISMY